MRIIAWLGTVVPSLAAGISVGRVVASLDAPEPEPLPLMAAITVTLVAAHVLDSLIDTLLAHRAANRG